MFCSNCGSALNAEDRFCSSCGQVKPAAAKQEKAGESSGSKPGKTIKSFLQYKKSKGKEWNSRVKGGKQNSESNTKAEQDVLIFIKLLEWNEKEGILKMKRGKKVGLRVSNKATASDISMKAEEKWKAYYSNLYSADQHYLLVYEDGQKVCFLPGTNEPFSLKRYHEESGMDYNRINLCLCTLEDHNNMLIAATESDCEDIPHPCKYTKVDGTSPFLPEKQIDSDEVFARQQESELNWDILDNEITETPAAVLPAHDVVVIDDGVSTAVVPNFQAHAQNFQGHETSTKSQDILQELGRRVNTADQFFLVTRRGSNLQRCLNLWQRESKRSKPDRVLRVHFTGEDGIDRGAMAKEFLAKVIADMGSVMFPAGSPIDSTNNVQNGYFQSCGEIVAVSLAQGGPPPCFLHECVYETMMNPKIDLMSLEESCLTPQEKVYLHNIVSDIHENSSTIIEHGFTGKIDQEHVEDITASILVSIVTRRQLYLNEFMKGLELYGLADMIRQNSEVFKQWFVTGQYEPVDANYVISLMKPRYSDEGSSKKEIEESLMDSFQDFLISLEDSNEKITGCSEALSWNYPDTKGLEDKSGSAGALNDEEFQVADVTVPGVLGWLTGQQHRPINGEGLTIFVNFDHDCLVRNPKHTVCFPCVGACGRELTLPVNHMKGGENFHKIFITALSKGQGFARP